MYIEILYTYGLWCSLDFFYGDDKFHSNLQWIFETKFYDAPLFIFSQLNFFYIVICFFNKKFVTANFLHSDDQGAVGDIGCYW